MEMRDKTIRETFLTYKMRRQDARNQSSHKHPMNQPVFKSSIPGSLGIKMHRVGVISNLGIFEDIFI